MKIAIPTDDNITVSEHFGRAPFFAVADTETRTINIVRNQTGNGLHVAPLTAEHRYWITSFPTSRWEREENEKILYKVSSLVHLWRN
jgi:hypothetical protein